MRNALELLQQKELDLVRIRKETEALRIVAPLLCDDRDQLAEMKEGLRGEQFDLQATGTDVFLSSADCVFPPRDGEISRGQPFLVPQPTDRASNDWQWLCEKKSRVLAAARGPAGRSWYGAAGGMLIVIAIGGYLLGHRIGDRVPATASAARVTAAFPPQPASNTETTPDRRWGVHSIEPAAQRPNANQPKPRETDAATGQEVHPENSQGLVDSVPTTSQTASDTDGAELMMGRRYLLGQGVAEDHAEAARWFWKSVAKQNGEAALLLSDLFARGDGVPKSCEQARIMLAVAAKHSPKTGATLDPAENEACR